MKKYRLIVLLLLILTPAALGTFQDRGDWGPSGDLVLYNDEKYVAWYNGDYYWAIKASGSLAGNYLFTWPVDDGEPNEVLTTDGSGVLEWLRFDANDIVVDGNSIELPTFTEGSIIFADPNGDLTEDNSNLFFDDTNNYVGIGTNTPNAGIQVPGWINFDPDLYNTLLGEDAGWAISAGIRNTTTGKDAAKLNEGNDNAIYGYQSGEGIGSGAGNNFSVDGNCKALWKMNDGAYTVDSIGNNTLTDGGGGVSSDAVNYKEGDASANFDETANANLHITDGLLGAGYPGKEGTSGTISICLWVRFEALANSPMYMYAKESAFERSFAVLVQEDVGVWNFRMAIGYGMSGGNWEAYVHQAEISAGVWYWVLATYNADTKAYFMHVWDDNVGQKLGSDISGTGVEEIFVSNERVTLGSKANGANLLDGKLDEVAVFSDIVTFEEGQEIRDGTYNVVGGGSTFSENCLYGTEAGNNLTDGSTDLMAGFRAGYRATTVDRSIYLGPYSGSRQTILDDRFILDNRQRTDAAAEITDCLFYGVMAATPGSQTLRINAAVTIGGGASLTMGSTTRVARLEIDDASTYIDQDGSSNMTFTDAVVGTKTLQELGSPTYKLIDATTQSEGDLHLSDASTWAVSKAMITTIRVVTSSTSWDLYILQNDNSYATDDANIGKLQLADDINGNANLSWSMAYEDEDASNEVHLYYLDNSGANTADIFIIGYQMI